MPVPKTNLFKGDRVTLSHRYFVRQKILNKHAPTGKWRGRTGTIVSDTLDTTYEVIIVWWDGCQKPSLRRDRGYTPEDLVMIEEEAMA